MLIDAHAHLDRYGDALEAALEEIAQHRIFTISNSLDLPSYKRNLEIGEMCELVLPTFGVHPWMAPEYADRLEDLHDAIEQIPMLGEIGLDYFFVEDPAEYPAQRKVLEFFLSSAVQQDKIVSVHTKGAEKDILDLLTRYDIQRAIIHWYSGPLDVFRELVSMGMYFTVGIEVLYSEHIRTIAREVPSDRLLTETDNPGGPKGLIGSIGMPALLLEVARGLAGARNSDVETITETVRRNLARLIEDDPWLSGTYARVFEGQHGGT